MVRTLVQNLRVGANWRSVVPALGRAAAIHAAAQAQFPSKQELASAAEAATDAFHSCPSLTQIVNAIQNGGLEALRKVGATIGVPVKPMLAKITTGVEDCVHQIIGNPVLIEYKYDGQRAQIHVSSSGQVLCRQSMFSCE
jgi:DNA ligase 1